MEMAAELQDSGVVAGVRFMEPDRERCISAHGKGNLEIIIRNFGKIEKLKEIKNRKIRNRINTGRHKAYSYRA